MESTSQDLKEANGTIQEATLLNVKLTSSTFAIDHIALLNRSDHDYEVHNVNVLIQRNLNLKVSNENSSESQWF